MIDAHHCIWRQADLPLLADPIQPRIFGPHPAIRRDYLIAEYLEDIAGCGVLQSVYVQAGWPAMRYLEEARWVQSVADETGWPHAIVAYADVSARDARPQLDELAKVPLVRGVCMPMHWHENVRYR